MRTLSLQTLLEELIANEGPCYLEDVWLGERLLGGTTDEIRWTPQQLLAALQARGTAQQLVEVETTLISLHREADNGGETARYWICPGSPPDDTAARMLAANRARKFHALSNAE